MSCRVALTAAVATLLAVFNAPAVVAHAAPARIAARLRHNPTRNAFERRVAEVDRTHVFVRFRGRPLDAGARLARAGARGERAMAGTSWTSVTTDGDALAVKSRLERDPAVAQVALSYVRHASTVPNDPRWASAERDYLAPLRMDRAWDRSKGDNVTIAVVDTGVDAQHPDLAGRVLAGTSFVPSTNVVQDDNGHGTMVAGILAANSDNARGIAGIAPHARILPVKVLDASGGGADPDIADGIRWAADHGANVINLSLGGPGDNVVLDQAISYAQSRGVIVVAAAGNGGAEGVDYPGAVPGVIAVSATTHSGALTAFSSYGTRVDIAAPGLDITTTGLSTPPNADFYTQGSGTSFSTPIVAGVVALIRAQNPSWPPTKVVQQLLSTARDVGPPGIDRAFGHGIVDPLAALGGPPLAPQPALPPGGDEPNDTPARATHLTFVGGIANYSGEIAPETDEDWYSITLTSGWWSAHVPTGAGALDHNMDPVVQLYDTQGRLLASQEFAGGDLLFNAAAGDYLVRVRNRGGDTAPYTLSIAPVATPPVYNQALPVDLLSSAQSVGIGDLNGDGRNDVAFLMGDSSGLFDTLVVLDQTATRSFVLGDVVFTPLQQTPGTGMVVGDVTGDGRADIAYPTTQGIQLVAQTAHGLQDYNFIAATGVTQLAIADLDGDGHPDVTAATKTGTRVYWGPNFNTSTAVPGGAAATTVAAGDLTGDGLRDLVTIEGTNTRLYRQTTPRAFAGAVNAPYAGASSAAFDASTGNLVLSYRSANAVRALHYSSGALTQVSKTDVASAPDAVTSATVDGAPSIVTMHDDSGDIGITPEAGGTEQTFLADDQPAARYDARGIAAGDIDGDGRPDVVVGTVFGLSLLMHRADALAPNYATDLAADVDPAPYQFNVSPDGVMHLALERAATNAGTTVTLLDAHGNKMSAAIGGDGTNAVTVDPGAALASGAYTVHVDGLVADNGDRLDGWNAPFVVGPMPDESAPDAVLLSPPSGVRTTAGVNLAFTSHDATAVFQCSYDNAPFGACTSPIAKNVTPGTHTFAVFARDPAGNESTPATASWTYRPVPHGYWMVGAAGSVYPFGTVLNFGNARTFAVQDLDVSPTGYGYWIVDAGGHVYAYGDARWYGNASRLGVWEIVTSISRTTTGRGYWLFTNLGRAFAFGDAKWYGDMRTRRLNAPVLDSVTTPSGRGYYMVAADGGVFTFGDAKFYGSTGSMRLPAPVRTLTPDPDGAGYWLVGTDGSVYPFNAVAHGSMRGRRLNKPIVGMVAYGHGYLMVAADGGIFNFSGTSFLGSLGSAPPPIPIVSVAAFG